jgi:hypothetical protein
MGKKRETGSRITVENVNVPGYTLEVDAAMYAAMRAAVLAVLPASPPGLTQTEIRQAVLAHLPENQFPGGAKADWWSKLVQLDLEAKGVVDREATKPLRWHRRVGSKRAR